VVEDGRWERERERVLRLELGDFGPGAAGQV